MAALFFLISVVSALIYFGIVRRLNGKWLEIVHFVAMYLLFLAPVIIIVLFPIAHGSYTDPYRLQHASAKISVFVINFIIPALFYVPSSFVVAYLLYPFKAIKRSKVLIWVLSSISVLITGVATLVEIAHAFSNM